MTSNFIIHIKDIDRGPWDYFTFHFGTRVDIEYVCGYDIVENRTLILKRKHIVSKLYDDNGVSKYTETTMDLDDLHYDLSDIEEVDFEIILDCSEREYIESNNLINPDFIKIRPKRKGIKLIREVILDRLKDRD